MADGTCSVESCDRPIKARGWCHAHYMRWHATGDPGTTPVQPPRPTICAVEGCEGKPKGRQWCGRHYQRWQATGDPLGVIGRDPERVGDAAGYAAVHRRLRVAGPIAERPCVECGAPAEEWAYDHTAPDERRDDKTGLPFTTDLSHYQPMCRKCHRAFDMR